MFLWKEFFQRTLPRTPTRSLLGAFRGQRELQRTSSSTTVYSCKVQLTNSLLNSLIQVLWLLIYFLPLSLFKPPEPRFEDLKSDGFHGLVKENERTVVVSPRIKVVDGKS